MAPPKGTRSKGQSQKDSRVTDVYQYRDFLAPRYWLTWLGIGSLYVMAWLPIAVRFGLSRLLSRVLYHVASGRRRVAETNIKLCFPHLNPTEQRKLVKDIFYSSTLSFFETAEAWCRSSNLVNYEIRGLEHLKQAREGGRGILLLSGHFGSIDLCGALLKDSLQYATVYRRHDSELFNYFMTRGRERYSTKTIARKDMRGLLRELKTGGVVWYAPDQDYGRKASVFVPFFGVSTATITMTSKVAKASNALVVPLSAYRTDDGRSIVLTFEPPVNIPSGDDVEDARLINRWLEEKIKEHPEQYLWLHKRFKTRPDNEPSFYS